MGHARPCTAMLPDERARLAPSSWRTCADHRSWLVRYGIGEVAHFHRGDSRRMVGPSDGCILFQAHCERPRGCAAAAVARARADGTTGIPRLYLADKAPV